MLSKRMLYIGILSGLFIYNATHSFLYMLTEPTVFEESELENNASMPSFTICPFTSSQDLFEFSTFENIMDRITGLKEIRPKVKAEIGGGSLELGEYDVLNETTLQEFNTTLDKTLIFSTYVQRYKPCVVPCFTLNWPFGPLLSDGYAILRITIPTTTSKRYFIERHERGQSRRGFFLDAIQDSVDITNSGIGNRHMFTETLTVSLKSRKHECYQNNSMEAVNCFNDFMAEELDCQLPWDLNPDLKMDRCKTELQFAAFRNLSLKMTSLESKVKLKKKGCFVPNCIQRSWKLLKLELKKFDEEDLNQFAFNAYVSSHAKVLKREEVKLADFSTFLADFGSYIGLFLGASFLSVIDYIFEMFGKLRSMQWCQKIRDS